MFRKPPRTTSPEHDVPRLIEQLAFEILREGRALSEGERDLLHRVLERGLGESTGDAALDAAVAQRLMRVVTAAIADRVTQALAFEIVRQLRFGRPVGPGMGPISPGRPVPGFEPGIGPFIGP